MESTQKVEMPHNYVGLFESIEKMRFFGGTKSSEFIPGWRVPYVLFRGFGRMAEGLSAKPSIFFAHGRRLLLRR